MTSAASRLLPASCSSVAPPLSCSARCRGSTFVANTFANKSTRRHSRTHSYSYSVVAECETWLSTLDNSAYYLQQQQQQQQREQADQATQQRTEQASKRRRNGTRWASLRSPEPAALPPQPTLQAAKPKRRANLTDIGGRDWLGCVAAQEAATTLAKPVVNTSSRSGSNGGDGGGRNGRSSWRGLGSARQRSASAAALDGGQGGQAASGAQQPSSPSAAAAGSRCDSTPAAVEQELLPTEHSLGTLLVAATAAAAERQQRPLVVIPKSIVDIGAVGWVEPGSEAQEGRGQRRQQHKNIVDIGAVGWVEPGSEAREVGAQEARGQRRQQHKRRKRRGEKYHVRDDAWLKKDLTALMQDLQRFVLGRS